MSNWIEYTQPEWRNFNMRDLKVDEAYLSILSQMREKLWLYSLSADCYNCPFTQIKTIPRIKEESLKLDVSRDLAFKVFDKDVGRYAPANETSICDFQPKLQEFGVYNLTINSNGTCYFDTDKDGVDIYLSMLTVILIFLLTTTMTKFMAYIIKRFSTNNDDIVEATERRTENLQTTKKRMKSLDTFRGMAIVLMIFVNSGGGHYWWIEHATWNGLHLADIVFPSFLWIMGVCIPISVKSQLSRGLSKWNICKNIAWRSLKLFLIGICLNSVFGPNLENLRIMGVLQRFGVAFLVCGVVHTIFNKGEQVIPQPFYKRLFYDIFTLKGELIFMGSLIVIYLGIVFGVAAPDCPRGYIGPGGKDLNTNNSNCIGGIVGYIDKEILGSNHIYLHPTAKYTYDSQPFDPEGIFGCLLTVVQVMLGVLCGMTILVFPVWKDRIVRWLSWSVALGFIGGLLCLFSREGGIIPINKNLWSLSFVFVTSSLAFFFLTVLYMIIDVKSLWNGYPFMECGKNAIVMYVGHTVCHKMLPWHWKIGAMNTHFSLLLECIWNTSLWILIAVYLDSIKWYYSL